VEIHAGKLDTDSVEGRLFRFLRNNLGQYYSGPELAKAGARDPEWPLTAVSTKISGIRKQLEETGKPYRMPPVTQVGKGFYYRLLPLREGTLFEQSELKKEVTR